MLKPDQSGNAAFYFHVAIKDPSFRSRNSSGLGHIKRLHIYACTRLLLKSNQSKHKITYKATCFFLLGWRVSRSFWFHVFSEAALTWSSFGDRIGSTAMKMAWSPWTQIAGSVGFSEATGLRNKEKRSSKSKPETKKQRKGRQVKNYNHESYKLTQTEYFQLAEWFTTTKEGSFGLFEDSQNQRPPRWPPPSLDQIGDLGGPHEAYCLHGLHQQGAGHQTAFAWEPMRKVTRSKMRGVALLDSDIFWHATSRFFTRRNKKAQIC